MDIRKANTSDAPIIADIIITSWRTSYCSMIPQKYLDNLSVEQKTISIQNKMLVPNWQDFFLISIAQQEIGTVKLRYDQTKGNAVGEIAGFYFLPNHTRQGYGTKTIQYLEQHLVRNGISCSFLWILSENIPSINFVEKNGYTYIGETKTIEIVKSQTLKKYSKAL